MIALGLSLLIFYLSGRYLFKLTMAPVEPWHRLLDFPVRTYLFSLPCPTLSTEVLRGNAAPADFSENREALDHFDGHVMVSMVISEDQQSQEKGHEATKKNQHSTKT